MPTKRDLNHVHTGAGPVGHPKFIWRASGTALTEARWFDSNGAGVVQIHIARTLSGRSAVWSARLAWDQEAVGSNPTVPTIFPL